MGDLVIDDASKQVTMRGQKVELSPKEYELLRLLAREPGRVFSHEEILSQVWTDSHLATAQDVKQYVYFLRQKLEVNPSEPQFILTVRGFGYKLHI
jgi:two-component system phosphate regulon response regulator PhoB